MSIDRGKTNVKNASLALYTIYNDEMGRKMQKVKVAHRKSKYTIPLTDPPFVSCSRVKAGNFSGFINISSETVFEKLSLLNKLHNYGDR